MKRLRVYVPATLTQEEIQALINWHLDRRHSAAQLEQPDREKWYLERRQFWGELMDSAFAHNTGEKHE